LEFQRPRVEELIRLLGSRTLRARSCFDELRASLDESSVGGDLDAISVDLAELEFAAARDKLIKLGARHGMEISQAPTRTIRHAELTGAQSRQNGR
jgi:hypothetical protein